MVERTAVTAVSGQHCRTIGHSATMTGERTGPDLSLDPAGPRGAALGGWEEGDD